MAKPNYKDLIPKDKPPNSNRDLLTTGYNVGGALWRKSLPGKALKFAITNDATKRVRNLLIEKYLPNQEHKAGYLKYLTGGTVGNKDVTNLSEHNLNEIAKAHSTGDYRNRNKFHIKWDYDEKTDEPIPYEGDPNPDYNPKSSTLRLYNQSDRSAYLLGHADLKQNEGGDYTLRDTYKVDDDPEYKPLRGTHSDLFEGKEIASRAYDIAKFLGINQNYEFKVPINAERLLIPKKEK